MSSMGFGRVIIADVYQAIMFDNSMDAKDMKDPLAPTSFSQELVGWMEKNAEDLEGDGPAMVENLSQDIIDTITQGFENGDIDANEKIIIDIALRDPHEGETIVLARTSAVIDEQGDIMLENSHPAYITNEEPRIIGQSRPDYMEIENKKAASDIYNSIRDKLRTEPRPEGQMRPKEFDCMTGVILDNCLDEDTDPFLQENEDNQTHEININVPSPFNRNPV